MEDYMSDDFLNSCLDNDVRPGLVYNRVEQRKYELENKKVVNAHFQKEKSSKTLAINKRNEGLDTALGPDNKGFLLLKKMGYKPGSSLGSAENGIIEPIPIHIKNDRKGLGREEALKAIRKKKSIFREKQKQVNVDDFRAEMSKKFRGRDIESDLLKSQKACHKFDTEGNFLVPEESWFWPHHLLPEDDKASDSEESTEDIRYEYTSSEKLEMLTVYLRKTYFYCIWCGLQYEDDRDLNLSCPGQTRDDH